ncbi:MAG: DUF882 domain-containing protein [Pseudomonadota bacterium]
MDGVGKAAAAARSGGRLCNLSTLVSCAFLLPLAIMLLFPSAAEAQNRTLTLYNTHTHERLTVTYKRNGRFVQGGLDQLNRFLRDWRRDEVTRIDPDLFDIVWNVYREVGASQPIHVVSAYRSPATNNMLRRRSSGVARNSQHTQGRAMDFFIPGVSAAAIRAAGLRQQQGGVGYYPRSNTPFVHLDTGTVRMWPRMTRSQLARVFPDGRTIHVPADGRPMAGFEQAQRDLQRGGRSSTRSTVQVASSASPEDASAVVLPTAQGDDGDGNIFAGLFGGGRESEPAAAPAPRAAAQPSQVEAAPARPERRAPFAAPAPVLPPNAVVLTAEADTPPSEQETELAAVDIPPPPVPAPTIDQIQIAAAAAAQPPVTIAAAEEQAFPVQQASTQDRFGAIDSTFAAAQDAQTPLPSASQLPPITRAQQIAQTVAAPGQIAALIEARFAEQRAMDASLRGQVQSALRASTLAGDQPGAPQTLAAEAPLQPTDIAAAPRIIPPAPTPVERSQPTEAPIAVAAAPQPPASPTSLASAFTAVSNQQSAGQDAIDALARASQASIAAPSATSLANAPGLNGTGVSQIVTGSAPARPVGLLHPLSEPATASLAKNSIRGQAHAGLVPPSDVLNLTPAVLRNAGFQPTRPFGARSDRFEPQGLTSTFNGR